MERIQEAVDRARTERQDTPGRARAGGTMGSAGLLLKSARDRRTVPLKVEYTETRCVPLNEDLLKSQRIVAGFNLDPRAEIYRQFRTQVLRQLEKNNWSSLAITSTREGAGKSLTAANLAISLARDVNHTVLLVDLDLRAPSLHKLFGFDVQHGLVDFLNNDIPLSECLVNPGIPKLVVLPNREDSDKSSEVLSSPKMKSFLKEAKNRYPDRIIIFDLPPLLRNDDAMIFTPYVDTTLLVVEDGVTTEEELRRSVNLLKGCDIIGTVLNKAR